MFKPGKLDTIQTTDIKLGAKLSGDLDSGKSV